MNFGPNDLNPSSNPFVELCRTGVQELDTQHSRIFQAIQLLEQSLKGPYPLDSLGARLQQLEGLVLEHFMNEEALMEQAHYPQLVAHRVEHEVILRHGHDLLDEYSTPHSPPLIYLPQALKTAFSRHIEDLDMDFVAFLADDVSRRQPQARRPWR